MEKRLKEIEEASLYRRLREVNVQGPFATVDGKGHVIHLCSNDYLGLSQDSRVVNAAVRALSRQVSQCSSRLIAGNDPAFLELEDMLARHRGTEVALVYPTGYAANLGAVSVLAGKDSVIFSDELNHASIIDACRLSGAEVRIFRHNDAGHLAQLLREEKNGKRMMVITEGIFSMDGDAANLREICALAQEHGAMTVVDDAHGDFIFGPEFSGVPAMMGAAVDVHVSSMSKGLGCFGGYVACSHEIRELLINTSRQFIYTSALPDHLCAAAITAVPIAKKGTPQKRLQKNIERFTAGIADIGFTLGPSKSQIIPVMIGDERKAVALSQELLRAGAFAQAVRYPTVKKGSARLRVSLTAMHGQKHVDAAIDAFKTAGKKASVI